MKMAKVLGIGGVFFKAEDPEELMRWYERSLGVAPRGPSHTGDWGVSLDLKELPREAYVQWSATPHGSRHFDGDFMFNLVVDDIDGALTQIEEHGGTIVARDFELENVGRFAWFMDPEGNRVELWQPCDPGGSKVGAAGSARSD
jgi:predicted enzyme related to lactoylglutathione lyase